MHFTEKQLIVEIVFFFFLNSFLFTYKCLPWFVSCIHKYRKNTESLVYRSSESLCPCMSSMYLRIHNR